MIYTASIARYIDLSHDMIISLDFNDIHDVMIVLADVLATPLCGILSTVFNGDESDFLLLPTHDSTC